MRCAHCGHDNPPDANYCLECGTELRRCRTCGRPLPGDARFCPACGASVTPAGAPVPEYTPRHLIADVLTSPGAVEGERKQVSVLFCDIVHSTALAQRLGPESFHDLLDRFFGIALEEVHRYQGTINQFLGDGFMALFGAPVAHEDHARQTVLAALAIRDALVARKDELGEEIAVRIGINTGLVVVGKIGDDLRADYTAFGDTTVLAARLQAAAEPGEILISPDAVELLNGYFEFEPAEEVVVKERTVQGYRVLGLGPRRARIDDVEQLNLTPLVGRERELETLLELFADAKRGSGQVVGITGEAGVGKSRLVLEFLRRLDKDAISLIETRCVPYGTAVPFLPIRDAVRTAAGITDEDDRGSVLRKLEHALVTVGVDVGSALPSLFDLLGISIESGRRVEIDPATVKRRIFETVRLMLVSYSKQRPLVLVVEDLHWLDRTSEEFFTEFVDDVAARPMLLVSTYRPGYGAPLIGKSFVTQLALRALIDADSMHLVRNLLAEPVAGDEVARTIVSRAEGNPLFLEELARAARERGAKAAAVDVPRTVQEIIAARLDSLDAASKGALQTAAVLGRYFSQRLFEATWEGDGAAMLRLQQLKRLEFLNEPSESAERTYGFRHGLTQEVAYDSLLERRRRVLHGRAAAALERLHADRLDEFYEVLAYHYARSDDLPRAVDYLALANRKAAARNAMEEALGYFYEASRILEALPDTHTNRCRRAELVLEQTPEFHFLNRHQEYYDLLITHESLMRDLGDDHLLGGFYARLGHRQWTLGPQFEAAVETSLRAAELCERSHNLEDAACAYMILSWTYVMTGDYARAAEYHEKALEKLDQKFDPLWWMYVRVGGVLRRTFAGDFAGAGLEGEETVAAARRRGDSACISFAAAFTAYAYLQQRDREQALAYAELAVAEAPTVYFQGIAHAFLGAALCHTGRRQEGLEVLATVVSVMEASGHMPAWMHLALLLAESHLVAGDHDSARDVSDRVREVAERSGAEFFVAMSHRLLGEVAYALGHDDDAAAHLERAITTSRSTRSENELALALADLGRVRSRLGDTADACRRLEQALDIFERLGTHEEPDRIRRELAQLAV